MAIINNNNYNYTTIINNDMTIIATISTLLNKFLKSNKVSASTDSLTQYRSTGFSHSHLASTLCCIVDSTIVAKDKGRR